MTGFHEILCFGLFLVLCVNKMVIFCRDSLCPYHLRVLFSDLIYCMFLYIFLLLAHHDKMGWTLSLSVLFVYNVLCSTKSS